MPSKIMSRQEWFFLQDESTYGVIPNTSGTATVAGGDAAQMIQFKMNRTTDAIVRKDKTGSRTATPGIPGRQSATWSANFSLVTTGVAGVVNDVDSMLKSLFGQAGSIKAGTKTITGATNATPISCSCTAHGLSDYDVINMTGVTGNTATNGIWAIRVVDANTFTLVGSSGNGVYVSGGTASRVAVKYSPADAQLSFTGWSFRTPSTAAQRVIFGCVAKTGTFNLGEDIATAQIAGDAKWQYDSNSIGTCTTAEKGGLTAFPTIPGSIVTSGTGIAGFKGSAVINGVAQVRIKSAQIKFGSGLELPRDIFGSAFNDIPEADERNVQVSFSLYEDDSASQTALEEAANRKTPIDLVFQLGDVPGSIFFFISQGVQLASPERDDSGRAFTMSYGDSRAYGSSISALNEFSLWAI